MGDKKAFEEQTKKQFTVWSRPYDSFAFRTYFEPLYQKIIATLDNNSSSYIRTGSRVLDIACGTGEVITRLAQHFPAASCTGIDITPAMVAKAKEKTKLLPNASITEGNATAIPFENELFDVIVCSEAFHHFWEPEHALAEMYRVLKKDGTLLIADPGRDSITQKVIFGFFGPIVETLKHIYTKKELQTLLTQSGFTTVSIMTYRMNNFFLCKK